MCSPSTTEEFVWWREVRAVLTAGGPSIDAGGWTAALWSSSRAEVMPSSTTRGAASRGAAARGAAANGAGEDAVGRVLRRLISWRAAALPGQKAPRLDAAKSSGTAPMSLRLGDGIPFATSSAVPVRLLAEICGSIAATGTQSTWEATELGIEGAEGTVDVAAMVCTDGICAIAGTGGIESSEDILAPLGTA